MDPSQIKSIKDDFKDIDHAVLTAANQSHDCATLLENWDPNNQEELWKSVYVTLVFSINISIHCTLFVFNPYFSSLTIRLWQLPPSFSYLPLQ